MTTTLTPKTVTRPSPTHPPAPAEAALPALLAATESYPWPSAPLDSERLRRYLATCYACGVGYALGAKAHDLLSVPPDYHNIDCSGWARAAIAVATDGRTLLPDGSVCQNDWCAAQGLKRSDYRSSRLLDGLTRIAFIRAGHLHTVGHVYLVQNGPDSGVVGRARAGQPPHRRPRAERGDDRHVRARAAGVGERVPPAPSS